MPYLEPVKGHFRLPELESRVSYLDGVQQLPEQLLQGLERCPELIVGVALRAEEGGG